MSRVGVASPRHAQERKTRLPRVIGVAPNDVLDQILTLQLAVGWAGESKTDPPRLGWWNTGLNDEFGGIDLFKRLTPRTWQWAVLESARAAARKVDAEARAQAADADQLVSLFRLGFEIDEQIDDRLAELKRTSNNPGEALPELTRVIGTWDANKFKDWLVGLGSPDVVSSSIGRRVKGELPDDPVAAARALVAALAPIAERYSSPHFKISKIAVNTKSNRG